MEFIINESGMLLKYSGEGGAVTVPYGVTAIGAEAFSSANITEVRLPEGIKEIGSRAFNCCASLSRVFIPESAEVIGEGAFFGCPSLREITVAEGNAAVRSGEGGLYTKDGSTLLRYLGEDEYFTLPEGCRRVGEAAFSSALSLIEVRLPVGLTEVGDLAFAGCKRLSAVRIPNSVLRVGMLAFCLCSSLKEVILPDGCKIGCGAFSPICRVYRRSDGGLMDSRGEAPDGTDLIGRMLSLIEVSAAYEEIDKGAAVDGTEAERR